MKFQLLTVVIIFNFFIDANATLNCIFNFRGSSKDYGTAPGDYCYILKDSLGVKYQGGGFNDQDVCKKYKGTETKCCKCTSSLCNTVNMKC
ncbi:hypothetical protein Mgra_00004753 [Meloidogyne graminicola]|uniref:Uncharacterized protein n=1 Tax=Meloidogyne graminicola TaxID=189291 RepID=A0A8S9ZRM7_9BILA|nr:hypothetical protein Mgra_00004753 [Meloidogyne graminicola]